MAHSRNIKPSFFIDENIMELSMQGRLLFIGLWCLADRDGKLDDKPKQIKVQVFPSDEINVSDELDNLVKLNVINRYTVNGKSYIKINNFLKHQRPHPSEKKSIIPDENSSSNVVICEKNLITDNDVRLCLNPESGILNLESLEVSCSAPEAHSQPTTKSQVQISDLDVDNWKTLPDRAIVKLSESWWLPQEWGDYAENLGWDEQKITAEAHKFRAYWTVGKGTGKRRSVKGWRQSWGNWIEKAARWAA